MKVKMYKRISLQVKDTSMEEVTTGFNPEIIKGKGMSLVAYIYRDSGFKQQVKVLNDLSKTLKNVIQIFLMENDDVRKYQEFDISGSPTFVLFYNGEEKGRLLGKADTKTLTDFISSHLLEMI